MELGRHWYKICVSCVPLLSPSLWVLNFGETTDRWADGIYLVSFSYGLFDSVFWVSSCEGFYVFDSCVYEPFKRFFAIKRAMRSDYDVS